MTTIHIQERTSTQVTEITHKDIESAIWAYAHNAAFDWDGLELATVHFYPKSDVISHMVFEFETETLTVQHEYDLRFTAAWEDK